MSVEPNTGTLQVHTPLLTLSQILSDEVSKALVPQSVPAVPMARAIPCDVHLHAECGTEDGEEHGAVPAEDRAAWAVSGG